MKAPHKHKCQSCGVVWQHNLRGVNLHDGWTAHNCPSCGMAQYEVYDGAEVATYCHKGVFSRPLFAPPAPASVLDA